MAVTNDSLSSHYNFTSTRWTDAGRLDPQLFPSSSSELAGAMTFPTPGPITSSRLSVAQEHSLPRYTPETSPITDGHTEMRNSSVEPRDSPVAESTFSSKPKAGISVEVLSEAATQQDGPLPPRFCSIKGCKAVLSGSTFYRMCEPCRNKYRNYGTKKRRKWKDDKEVAVAEFERLQQEDVERISQGLPVSRFPSPVTQQVFDFRTISLCTSKPNGNSTWLNINSRGCQWK